VARIRRGLPRPHGEPYAVNRKIESYAKFAAPYDRNDSHPNIYSGAARDIRPKNLTEVRIGLSAHRHIRKSVFGLRMLHVRSCRRRGQRRGVTGASPFN